jgi:hypothetical protein
VITFTGKKTGYGILVEVNHSQGYATRTPPRLRLETSFLVTI